MPASKQIMVYQAYSIEDQSFSFKISGKTPTLVSGGQGDHVTAFALVKKGIARYLEQVFIRTPEDLEKVRTLRDTTILDGYISSV